MARNTVLVDTTPAAVWEVLADPRLYGSWVVGASTAERVEGRWPDVGAVLHHNQMMVLRDTTSVLEAVPERRLVLEARVRPVIVARVEVTLEPAGRGTRIVLEETTTGGLAAALPGIVVDRMIHVRNREAVRRLKRLSEIGEHLGEA